jgi:hypothetical protein
MFLIGKQMFGDGDGLDRRANKAVPADTDF